MAALMGHGQNPLSGDYVGVTGDHHHEATVLNPKRGVLTKARMRLTNRPSLLFSSAEVVHRCWGRHGGPVTLTEPRGTYLESEGAASRVRFLSSSKLKIPMFEGTESVAHLLVHGPAGREAL